MPSSHSFYIAECTDLLLTNIKIRSATKYISPVLTVKATRRSTSNRAVEIVVTIGRPNCLEREFIDKCIEAGEKFPVRKIQLKYTKGA